MPYPQDANDVERGLETIEGEISGCSPRDDEFANIIVYRSPDKWMCFEDTNCASDVPKRALCAWLRKVRATGGSLVRRFLLWILFIRGDLAQGARKNITENITELGALIRLTLLPFLREG